MEITIKREIIYTLLISAFLALTAMSASNTYSLYQKINYECPNSNHVGVLLDEPTIEGGRCKMIFDVYNPSGFLAYKNYIMSANSIDYNCHMYNQNGSYPLFRGCQKYYSKNRCSDVDLTNDFFLGQTYDTSIFYIITAILSGIVTITFLVIVTCISIDACG